MGVGQLPLSSDAVGHGAWWHKSVILTPTPNPTVYPYRESLTLVPAHSFNLVTDSAEGGDVRVLLAHE